MARARAPLTLAEHAPPGEQPPRRGALRGPRSCRCRFLLSSVLQSCRPFPCPFGFAPFPGLPSPVFAGRPPSPILGRWGPATSLPASRADAGWGFNPGKISFIGAMRPRCRVTPGTAPGQNLSPNPKLGVLGDFYLPPPLKSGRPPPRSAG